MRERRAMASRPYYRSSSDRAGVIAYVSTLFLATFVGGLIGACITLGVMQ